MTLENPWTLEAGRAGELDVGHGHRLWWAHGGVADAAAPWVVVIHGGPGGRSRNEPLAWLAGARVRWLCWDQRGCGRSRPAGERAHNDLAHLLDDLDALLEAVGASRVALLAGSWGAVPALEYARTRPDRVHGLLLRSAFTALDDEVRAFFEPWDAWLGEAGRGWLGAAGAAQPALHTVSRYGACAAVGADGRVAPRLAWAWSAFENEQCRPGGLARSGATFAPPAGEPGDADVAAYEIQAHYLVHRCFVPEGAQALWRRDPPPGPLALVHGCDDQACPVENSRAFAQAWPQAQVDLVEGAGHRMGDERLAPRLRAAVQAWCSRLAAQG